MVYPFIDRNFWPNRVLERDGGMIIVFILFVLFMCGKENEDPSKDKTFTFDPIFFSACMLVVRFSFLDDC